MSNEEITIGQIEELNEAIGCYEDKLNDLRKNKTMSIAEKVNALNEMATKLSQEKEYIYQ